MTAGLTTTGFVEKSATEIADELAAEQRASSALGSAWVTNAESPSGQLNAIMAGATECGGGVLLALGLFARPASVPLIFTMLVAYGTADRDALNAITSDPDKFVTAAPFLFLLASLIVLAFGPGKLSLDALLGGKGRASSASA